MAALGLGNVARIEGVHPTASATGAYGRLTEVSHGKDTTTGHWELAGIQLTQPFPVYPNGFPRALVRQFEEAIGRATLGNVPASGTEIIDRLGAEHVESGCPIVYTSADSVFQIAAHEDVIPVEELYDICVIARGLLTGEHAVGRVIARPFSGTADAYRRTSRRKDFSLPPPSSTILDAVKGSGRAVFGIGKIEDIFAGRGLTESVHTSDNMAGIDATITALSNGSSGLIFTNLVDFDSLYGHRNDPIGYAAALEAFDARLPEITSRLGGNDVLMVTADHGNDPTTAGTDHSRERVPILLYGRPVRPNSTVNTRTSFADVAATIGEFLKFPGGVLETLSLRTS
jgi:phosphopentomutase